MGPNGLTLNRKNMMPDYPINHSASSFTSYDPMNNGDDFRHSFKGFYSASRLPGGEYGNRNMKHSNCDPSAFHPQLSSDR